MGARHQRDVHALYLASRDPRVPWYAKTLAVLVAGYALSPIQMLKAKLHPVWVPRGGYRYSVIFRGELLVDRSRDPECDAARALVAKGITGRLTMLDGKTGQTRTVIDMTERLSSA